MADPYESTGTKILIGLNCVYIIFMFHFPNYTIPPRPYSTVQPIDQSRSFSKPAARTAIEEYERIERERIHLSTAARVLNYEAEGAERKRKSQLARAREEPSENRHNIHAWHPLPVCVCVCLHVSLFS